MNSDTKNKVDRTLGIYTKLINGAVVNKAQEAAFYGVNERSIQRDIDDIRDFMDRISIREGVLNNIIYDRAEKGYRLEQIEKLKLTNPEILAICKIILDSRSLRKEEMTGILDKLIDACVPEENRKLVHELIANEAFHYIEPQHGKVFIDKLWQIGQAIHESRYIEIQYQGMLGSTVKTRKVKPVAIMFNEFYFYMTGFLEDKKVRENFNVLDDSFPTIYRIDRIQSLRTLDEHYFIPYRDRFEEGEFRKRIQFMFGGKLRRVKFKYSGYSIEAIMDRLPTAKILSEEDGVYTVSAEVFGDGIDMWLRSQGDRVEVVD